MTVHDQLVSVDPLRGITAVPVGKVVSEVRFTWTVSQLIETMKAYDEAELLFTLTFTWNADSTLQKVVRS